MEIKLGTSTIPVWCSPLWANLATANWRIFNLTFVGAPIDYLTQMIWLNSIEHDKKGILKVSVLQAVPS